MYTEVGSVVVLYSISRARLVDAEVLLFLWSVFRFCTAKAFWHSMHVRYSP